MIRADVLVVGGGSAGCVVAARLSERASVILVEAGPRAAPVDACALPIGDDRWARHYDAELTPGVHATVPRGRVLGGSGAVNGGYFARALPSDFAAWPWSYDDVLPYYRALETDHDFSGPAHGDSGPMPVRRARSTTAFDDRFVDACVRAGYSEIADLNAGEVRGVGLVPANVVDGVRVSTAAAYLHPGVRVLDETVLETLVFDGTRVVGANVVRRGERFRIESGRTVVCAGAIETPLLLLRSGVGDPDALRSAGVCVVHALRGVGEGFADHPEWTAPRPGTGVHAPPLQVVLNTGDVEIRPYTGSFAQLIEGNRDTTPRLGVALMHPPARGAVRLRDGVPSISYHFDAGFPIGFEGLFAALGVTGPWTLGTSQHMTGTCRMGVVVDERLRVLGLEGVTIVDASVIPSTLSRGVHATVVMLAELAADLLLRDGS